MAHDAPPRQSRFYITLLQLLATDATIDLRSALAAAGTLIARALEADKVDVLLHDHATESLVAICPPVLRMEQEQRASGLDRLHLIDGGPEARCFRTGARFRTGRVDRETGARLDDVPALEILSVILCRLHTDGSAHGVLQAASAREDWFSEADLEFLEAAASWMGLVMTRADLVDRIATNAIEEGRVRAGHSLQRLTRREREVAVLVAGGLTNDEIAERLVLVRGTVANHIVHILRKLDFSRRIQIATWAVACGLWARDAEASD